MDVRGDVVFCDLDDLAAEMRRGLYETIFRRRDVRAFLPNPIPNDVLARVLIAAHNAGSVGYSQPWSFIIVRDLKRRRDVKQIFEEERVRNAAQFSGARREKFLSLKLEGILEAPLNIVVTCETGRFGSSVLGKTSIHDVEVYSTCLAIQNLWLAARAEGLGLGWVSILRNEAIRAIFDIPESILPVAYLCMGYVESFPPRPTLESVGWAERLPTRDVLRFESWESAAPDESLYQRLEDPNIWRGILEKDRQT